MKHTTRSRSRRNLLLENLETRRLMTHVVNGTSGNDTITVEYVGGDYVINVNGGVVQVDGATVSALQINGGAGHDTITLKGNGAKPATINGADGNDTIRLGDDLDTQFASSSVSVVGGSGSDVLWFMDRQDVGNDDYTLTAGRLTKSSDTMDLRWSGIERVELSANDDDNDISVQQTTDSTITYEILANNGNDTLLAGGGSANARVIFVGGTGSDSIDYADQNNLAAGTYQVRDWQLSRTGNGLVEFGSTTEQLIIRSGTSGNTFSILNCLPAVQLETGAGSDTIHLGDGDVRVNLPNGVTLDAGDGTDTLVFNDTAEAAGSDSHTLTNARVTLGGIEYDHAGLEAIVYNGSASHSTFRVDSSTVPTTLRGGAGNDTIYLANGDLDTVAGSFTIDGQGGADTLILRDFSDSGADTYSVGAFTISKPGGEAFAPAAYLGIENLDLLANHSANTITVDNPGASMRVFGNNGDDTIRVVESIGPVVVDAGNGLDVLEVNEDDAGSAWVVIAAGEALQRFDLGLGGRLSLMQGADANLIVQASSSVRGQLDINDNWIIRRSAGASARDYYADRVANGYAAGGWNGTNASVISTWVKASAIDDGIAVVQASAIGLASFDGAALNPGDLLITPARRGDANLDGQVSFGDLLIVAQNYNPADDSSHWARGDFDHDGVTGFADILTVAQNFGSQSVRFSATRIARDVLA